MKKIIFLDLDGTLWTFEKIPSSALKAIELARKNGHSIYSAHCQRFRILFRGKQNDIY